jgi:hypothetical protein
MRQYICGRAQVQFTTVHNVFGSGNFHSCTVHLDAVKVFIYQLMHNRVALKKILKIYIKTAPTCFGLITIIRERIV